MDNPSWDDGSLAPIFIRLAWHSSGTYDRRSRATGGSNGAGMRFEKEASDGENAGLHTARAFLEPIKRKFPGICTATCGCSPHTLVWSTRAGRRSHSGPAASTTRMRTRRRTRLRRKVCTWPGAASACRARRST